MSPVTETPALSAVPSTLRIPLAARALGARLFPHMAVDDRYAMDALRLMGDDGSQWLSDHQTIYGVLARTRSFRDQAREFLQVHPRAHVVNLGCGLSDYLQWLDNGSMRMTDSDLPEVTAIRARILPPRHERHVLADLDLNDASWWDRLGLPATPGGDPVFLMSEGVFMYLDPATVTSVLATFGERAPAGSLFTFDAMCWLAIGRARHNDSVRLTEAEFRWGPRHVRDVTEPHERLVLRSTHSVMQTYNFFYQFFGPMFRATTGVPIYAVYTLEAAAVDPR